MSTIQIKPTCIFNFPFQSYYKDFSFIVNGDEIKTSRLVSDLISPIISRLHSQDPTLDTFTINTTQQGDFSHILELVNFNPINIPEDELEFFVEVVEILGN